jgi:nitrile hydratase
VERGYATPEELAAGRASGPAKPLKRKMTADDIGAALTRGKYGRPATAPARFKIGDRVRTLNINPATHTRLPRYARGRTGVIERIQGCHVFPDSVAIDKGENPQWLYTVLFDGRELWGPQCEPSLKVSIEAFEPYLEPA